MSELKIGIAISTYLRKHNPERLKTTINSINGLMSTNFIGLIILIDDHSPSKKHIKYAEKHYPDRIQIIRKKKNGGIAKCKNTCLHQLKKHGCDIFILLDDDVLFLDPNWWIPYCNAIAGGVNHLSVNDNNGGDEFYYNDIKLRSTGGANGFALFYSKNVIIDCGYFKVPKAVWGHEHVWYSIKIAQTYNYPNFIDICDRNLITTQYTTSSIKEKNKSKFAKKNSQIFNDYSTQKRKE